RLSHEEGIPEAQWCFEISGPEDGDIRLRKDYLKLTGYRLATEAEMEYATRAGATTSRYYGETGSLLGVYGWYQKNSNEKPQPVGRLKPNELGLFDSLGNCYSWCMDAYADYPESSETADREGSLVIDGSKQRLLRGGSFSVHPTDLRSAGRDNYVPALRSGNLGFRLARTLPH
ncbi:MAG: formylglycine-generating enzyme family protein, partial [Planctomycetes bacterium]|nr:formylglycine-generating enzyme family protein [Planctomycetota bacterium]